VLRASRLSSVVVLLLFVASCGAATKHSTPGTHREQPASTTQSNAASSNEFAGVVSDCEQSGGSALLPGSGGQDASAVPDNTPAVCGCWTQWMASNLSSTDQTAIVTSVDESESFTGATLTNIPLLGQIGTALSSCDLGRTPPPSSSSGGTSASSSGAAPASVGGCGTVLVPGGHAQLTITDRTVSCATALPLVRAFVTAQQAHLNSSTSTFEPSMNIQGWNCGVNAEPELSCEKGNTDTHSSGIYFLAPVRYTEPSARQPSVSPTVAAGIMVEKLGSLLGAQPAGASSYESCSLSGQSADITVSLLYLGTKLPCSTVTTLAQDSYGEGSWSLVPAGAIANQGTGVCNYMGSGRLTRSDNISVAALKGPTATDLCSALAASGNWIPQAG